MSDYDISPTLAAKSDQLNAADLAAPTVFRVIAVHVRIGDEQPVVIDIDGGGQPYKPCKGMRRLLAKSWGTDASAWVGRAMRLYCDTTVTYGGQTVGGIRIDGLSDVEGGARVKIPISRGRYKEFQIEPLAGRQRTETTDAIKASAISPPRHKLIEARIGELGLDRERVKAWVKKAWGVEHLTDIPPERFGALITKLETWASAAIPEQYAQVIALRDTLGWTESDLEDWIEGQGYHSAEPLRDAVALNDMVAKLTPIAQSQAEFAAPGR